MDWAMVVLAGLGVAVLTSAVVVAVLRRLGGDDIVDKLIAGNAARFRPGMSKPDHARLERYGHLKTVEVMTAERRREDERLIWVQTGRVKRVAVGSLMIALSMAAPGMAQELPLSLQAFRIAGYAAHASDYGTTLGNISVRRAAAARQRALFEAGLSPYRAVDIASSLPGGWERAPFTGRLAYRPGWFALYKVGVAWAADRAIVGLYRHPDQDRKAWMFGMRRRHLAWILAISNAGVPGAAAGSNAWRLK